MKKYQKGFGLIETLLILILVTLLGFVGWYVWNSQDKNKDNTNQSANSSAIQSDNKNTSAFKIKELGIQFKLPDELKELIYATHDNTVSFYMPDLNKLAPSCDKDTTVIAINVWSKGSGKYEDVPGMGLVKQFNNFYIAREGGPSGLICSDESVGKKISDLKAKYATALYNSESSVELIK